MRLLSQIKKDLDFNLDLAHLIQVLKEISISQYHSLERKTKVNKSALAILNDFFAMIDTRSATHPFLSSANKSPAVIAVTSDMGLLGALNMQVMTLALKEVEQKGAQLIIVGERGKSYAQETKVPFVGFDGIKDSKKLSQAMQLRDYVTDQVSTGRFDTVKVFYPEAISLMCQRIQTFQLLPWSETDNSKAVPVSEIILESSINNIAGYLVYMAIGHKFYEIFGLSRLAELAARFLHLEESENKLEDIKKELRIQYFRQRHELIDRGMRELFAARLAFK